VGGGGEAGRIMFEMAGVDLASASEAMKLAAHKLPIRTKFVTPGGGTVMAERNAEKS
jgi:ribosomal protein L16/L10AE